MHAIFSRSDFDKAVAPLRSALIRYASRRAGPDNGEDLVQDALLRAWNINDRFNADSGPSAFFHWLLSCLRHIVDEWIRRQAHRAEKLLPPDMLLALSDTPDLTAYSAEYRLYLHA